MSSNEKAGDVEKIKLEDGDEPELDVESGREKPKISDHRRHWDLDEGDEFIRYRRSW